MLYSMLPFLSAYEIKMNLGNAAVLALLGLVIVFAVLAVLVGLLTLFKAIFNIKITKKPQVAENNVESVAQNAAEEDYDEIVAVITAALACMNEEEAVKAPFVVKSITKLK